MYLVTKSKTSKWRMCIAWVPRMWGLLLHEEEGLEGEQLSGTCVVWYLFETVLSIPVRFSAEITGKCKVFG